MVINFSTLNVKEDPILLLRNADGTIIQSLGYAMNVSLDAKYNEVSTLSFDIPSYVNGTKTPHYDDIIGMRIVDVVGWGQFILVNPSVEMDGIKEIKSCKAYSLEYELTYKKLSLEEGTYNLWNPFSQKDTIIGILLSYLPSWSVGVVDDDLIGKYRTFSVENENLYNFIKSTLQQSYSCIFDFDTYKRKINVRSTASHTTTSPVYISLDNLAKEIEIEEDTENIFTCLDVNGAEGVGIRTVNPMGSNKIYNLDYFMNTTHFSQNMIDKWNSWKQSFESHQFEYYNISIDRSLKTAAILAEEAALTEMTGRELASLHNLQAVYIEQLASTNPDNPDYAEFQQKLSDVNAQIEAKNAEITIKENLIASLESEKEVLTNKLLFIQNEVAFSRFFSSEELIILDRYIKEDSIEDSTFVISTVDTYTGSGESSSLLKGSSYIFNHGDVTKILGVEGKELYSIKGGTLLGIFGMDIDGWTVNSDVISASFERKSDGSFVLSAYLSNGYFGGSNFPSGSFSMTGFCHSLISDVKPDEDAPNSYLLGSSLGFTIDSGNVYFTKNVTEYERYSVEWDLYEYGQECLSRLAYPSYSFKVSVANFFALDDFVSFAKNISLGQKVYLQIGEGKVLQPILIGVEIDFENPSSMSLSFGDRYSLSDSTFSLVELLNQSISMGKTVDLNKFSYSAFVDSGASTSVKEFMKSALDVAKNAILSSSDISVSWDSSGIRCRRLIGEGVYDPKQLAIINRSICFTDDGWQTAKMAIGEFEDTNAGTVWGIVAPYLVGTILAGSNLIIESAKKDGGVAVFRVDGEGASLHNATFDIYNGSKTHISLNPYSGFAIGSYPVYSGDNYTIDENKAKFWVDLEGNVHMKGTLHGVNGTFSGELVAATGTFSGKLSAATGTFSGIVQAEDFLDKNGKSMMNGDYKFNADYLNLLGLNVGNGNLVIDSDGNINMKGNITMTDGSISWDNVNTDPVATNAATTASNAYSRADAAYYNANAVNNALTALENGIGYTFIDGKYVISPNIIGGKIEGGEITSNTKINVATDINLGNNIYLRNASGTNIQAIVGYGNGHIQFNNGVMDLSAKDDIVIQTVNIRVLNNRVSQLETKINTLLG